MSSRIDSNSAGAAHENDAQDLLTATRTMRAASLGAGLRVFACVLLLLGAVGAGLTVAEADGGERGWDAALAVGELLGTAVVAAVLAALGNILEMQVESFRETRAARWGLED